MAIESKVALMNELERDLSTRLTAADMSAVMSVLSDRLAGYDVKCTGEAPDANDDLLDAYLNALDVQGRSPKTLTHYRYVISRMMKSVKTPTRRITVYHLRNYLASEKARGISDHTLETTRQAFSAYFNWLHREGLIETNPTANLGAIKYPKLQKELYSDADLERLKFGCKTIRDRAIVCFLKATGCRISEMCQLNRADINFAALECKVLGKGNKERPLFLDEVAAMTLQEYLSERKDTSPALFAGKGTDRLKDHGVRKMLTQLAKRTNVHHVHPHKFRRTLATNLIRKGMAIQTVAAILGHDKLDTTMEYVTLDKSDVKNSYRKYA